MEEIQDFNKEKTIKIEERTRHHSTYYVDANGILTGEWGDCHYLLDEGPNGEKMYALLYNRYNKIIPINEFGYFYNIFSCKKYDGVIKIETDYCSSNLHDQWSTVDLRFPPDDGSLYYGEKNNRFGIIDSKGREILHICYNKIERISTSVFIVSCETGEFVYNTKNGRQSDVYEELHAIDSNYIRYKYKNGYGLLNSNGEIVTKPTFEKGESLCYRSSRNNKNQLQIKFNKYHLGVYIQDDLFYGKISPKDYDWCAKVDLKDTMMGIFYITSENGKYGILNSMFECVSAPLLDDIIFVDRNKTPSPYSVIGIELFRFVIAKQNGKFVLFNTTKCERVLDGCSKLEYKLARTSNTDYIEYEKDGQIGYVTRNGLVIDNNKYNSITKFDSYYLVSKNGKYGALDNFGRVIFPCEFENIESIYEEFEAQENSKRHRRSSRFYNESQHYSEYAGSYAQDEMGYSDEDINTIFEGDPDAYWTID